MQQNDIQATLTRVLGEVAKVNPTAVARDKRLREDLGLDSLTLIEVAVAAEDAFGVPLPDARPFSADPSREESNWGP